MEYTRQVLRDLQTRHPEQREFLQAAKEVLESLTPVTEDGAAGAAGDPGAVRDFPGALGR